jgi:peptidyl-prolyl cis-trans isomerase A (cyclophilin A)
MKKTFSFILLAAGLGAQTPPPAAPAQPPKPALEPGLYATIKTSMGDIVLKLFEVESPITVKNFIDLGRGSKAWKDPKTQNMVRRPLYAGTVFHRVIPGFMIQGGDPTGTGMGEIGWTIEDEFVPTLKFDVPGRLAMANTGDPHTGSSQFFITEVPTPHLNGKHTIFGQVVEGQEVVNKIAHVATKEEKPLMPIRLLSITFKREGPMPPGGVSIAAPPAAKKSAPGVKKAAPPAKKATPAVTK